MTLFLTKHARFSVLSQVMLPVTVQIDSASSSVEIITGEAPGETEELKYFAETSKARMALVSTWVACSGQQASVGTHSQLGACSCGNTYFSMPEIVPVSESKLNWQKR